MTSGCVDEFRRVVNNRSKTVKLRKRARLQCKLKKREAARKHRYIDVKNKKPGTQAR